jgi:heparanase 1
MNVSIAATSPLRELPESFLGVNLDWWPPHSSEPWGNASVLLLDIENPRLNKLAAALKPGTLRIGGSLDKIVQYLVDGQTEADCDSKLCLNMTRWAKVVDFALTIGAQITWGLSYPVQAGTRWLWNGTNPTAFLTLVAANATQSKVILGGIELGEEIEMSVRQSPEFENYLGSWATFAGVRNKLWPSSNPAEVPGIFGPCPGMGSFTNMSDFWLPLLKQTALNRSMDVVVFHSYNNPSSWPQLLDNTLNQARAIVAAVAEVDVPAGLPQPRRVVLGEGGPHNGGGIMGITNTFASSSYCMDALGLLPVVGVTGFNRQTLVGGDYELLNKTTFLPNPDYWVAYGYRQLVGPKVLSVTATATDPTVQGLNTSIRVYAHCAVTTDPTRAVAGDITLFWSSVSLTHEFDMHLDNMPQLSSVDMYVLLPHNSTSSAAPVNVLNGDIDLNGNLLALGQNDTLPAWTPSALPRGTRTLRIPPAAVGWAVLHGASAPACQ